MKLARRSAALQHKRNNQPEDTFMKNQSYLSYIFKIQQLYDKMLYNIIRKLYIDVNADQIPVLFYIKRVPHSTQQEIARTLSRDKASITRTIKCLIQKGYILSQVNVCDTRKNILTLTTQGQELTDSIENEFCIIEENIRMDALNINPLAFQENFEKLNNLCKIFSTHIQD